LSVRVVFHPFFSFGPQVLPQLLFTLWMLLSQPGPFPLCYFRSQSASPLFDKCFFFPCKFSFWRLVCRAQIILHMRSYLSLFIFLSDSFVPFFAFSLSSSLLFAFRLMLFAPATPCLRPFFPGKQKSFDIKSCKARFPTWSTFQCFSLLYCYLTNFTLFLLRLECSP